MSDLRCPRCGAVRRHGDQWCGLCFADFRQPPPEVVGDGVAPPAPQPVAAPPSVVAGELPPPLIRPPVPGAVPSAPVQPVATPVAQPVAPAAQSVPTIPAQPTTPLAPRSTPAPFVPSTNPLAPTATMPTQLPAGVAPTAPDALAAGVDTGAAPHEDATEPALTWPCPRCDELVPMSEDYCSSCGHGFLDDVRTRGGTKLPLVGDVSQLDSGQKLMFGTAIAVGIIVGLIVLFTLLDLVFH
ncbi:MAG: hypothetical protein ACTHK4_02790 [Mycobacteriales bacterium]